MSGTVSILQARGLDLLVRVGSLSEPLDAPGSLAGIVAFYSLIHLPREQVTPTRRGGRTSLRAGLSDEDTELAWAASSSLWD